MKFQLHLLVLVFCITFSPFPTADAQSGAFIYGTVKSWDDKSFTGQIRWGKEEAFWTDMFNASKDENEYVDYLSKEDFEKLRNSRGEDSNWWDRVKVRYVNNDNFIHQFSCQFGNLKRIKRHSSSRIVVELKDGTELRLRGEGYNDVGARIRVYVADLGKVELDWDDVEEVTFSAAPSNWASAIGGPLYGKVDSWNGEFEGLIHWDKDERVESDVLDGEDNDRDLEIEFGNIRSIEKRGRGSEVITKSGQTYLMDSSNDVDNRNKGIIVTAPGKGRVDVDWDDFEKLTLMDAPISLPNYNDFDSPKFIQGTIITSDGKQKAGRIIYDLDEAYTFEILNGKKGDTEFEIPFHDIKQIRPRSSGKSIVLLNNGTEFMLEDSQDVSYRHSGILLFPVGQDDPTYIAWDEVEKIELN